MPGGACPTSPLLTFHHYVATEAGFDGGNVKISIGGGAFTTVPKASAYTFNAPTTLATVAAGNTSPLANQQTRCRQCVEVEYEYLLPPAAPRRLRCDEYRPQPVRERQPPRPRLTGPSEPDSQIVMIGPEVRLPFHPRR